MANLINPKGSHDLEQRIADLTKQKEFLQDQGFRFTNGVAHQACGFQN